MVLLLAIIVLVIYWLASRDFEAKAEAEIRATTAAAALARAQADQEFNDLLRGLDEAWDPEPDRIVAYRSYFRAVVETDPERDELLPQVVAEPAPAEPVFFKPGEPQRFAEFGGQHRIVELLEATIGAMAPDAVALPPQIMLGPAGSGKTLLAKVMTNELRARAQARGLPQPVFLEVFPADLASVEELDQVVLRAAAAEAAVLFIDEVHGLEGTHSHKLYELLENGRYKFHDDPLPVLLPGVTMVAATTDFGLLHPALQRRWTKHYFEPATPAELAQLLERRARAELPAAPAALELIVARTHFAGQPWEAVELWRLALIRARSLGAPRVTEQHVDWVLENQGIDDFGLRRLDRQVITALLGRQRTAKGGEMVYGASENDTCLLARVDKAEYRDTIRPKLMARGLLELRPGVGQCLTAAALERYGQLPH